MAAAAQGRLKPVTEPVTKYAGGGLKAHIQDLEREIARLKARNERLEKKAHKLETELAARAYRAEEGDWELFAKAINPIVEGVKKEGRYAICASHSKKSPCNRGFLRNHPPTRGRTVPTPGTRSICHASDLCLE
jgi:hypothetical protein